MLDCRESLDLARRPQCRQGDLGWLVGLSAPLVGRHPGDEEEDLPEGKRSTARKASSAMTSMTTRRRSSTTRNSTMRMKKTSTKDSTTRSTISTSMTMKKTISMTTKISTSLTRKKTKSSTTFDHPQSRRKCSSGSTITSDRYCGETLPRVSANSVRNAMSARGELPPARSWCSSRV